MSRWIIAVTCCFFAWSPRVAAQVERYDTGRKLIAFEKAFGQQNDAEAHRRAIPGLQKAFSSFMSGRLGEAGRALDDARWSLASAPPDDIERWAATIVFRPSTRLLDPKNGELKVTVNRLYDPKVDAPTNIQVRLAIVDSSGSNQCPIVEQPLTEVPTEIICKNLRPEAGDVTLRAAIFSGKRTLALIEHPLSLALELDSRVARLQTAIEGLPESGLTTDQLTLKSHVKLLGKLAKGTVGETAFPAERMLREAEAIAQMPASGRFFNGQRSGQFWLTLATPRPSVVRLQVPATAKDGQPIPLVVAMHGAGGSENLFFDAYGCGEVGRQCAQRGWLLATTRTELLAPPAVADIVDELAKLYPVDKSKIFIVGHSMGAGQALALARQQPDRWAGIAALGGGGRMVATEAMKRLPFFIGCGTEDFAIRSAKSTAKSLLDGGVANVEFRDYPDIEHIAIVQVALPDVFKWYDSLLVK